MKTHHNRSPWQDAVCGPVNEYLWRPLQIYLCISILYALSYHTNPSNNNNMYNVSKYVHISSSFFFIKSEWCLVPEVLAAKCDMRMQINIKWAKRTFVNFISNKSGNNIHTRRRIYYNIISVVYVIRYDSVVYECFTYQNLLRRKMYYFRKCFCH